MSEYDVTMEELQPLIDEDRKRRIMRSSTFKAIAALEDVPPNQWGEALLEEVIEDVIEIDRVRWFERAIWGFVVLAVGAGAFMLGWYMKPIPEPERVKWECTVAFDAKQGDEVDCTGVQ